MTTDTLPSDILQRIRDKVAESKRLKVPADFRPPTRVSFTPNRQILCFDQSLSNSGWAVLNTSRESIRVVDSGTIRPTIPLGLKGFEASFAKAIQIASGAAQVVRKWPLDDVVLELPSVVGYRTESSFAAAVAICIELDRIAKSLPDFVSRQAAGSLLCGDRHASKVVSSKFVTDLVASYPTGTGQWTEHVRDAVFVGLRHLLEGAK